MIKFKNKHGISIKLHIIELETERKYEFKFLKRFIDWEFVIEDNKPYKKIMKKLQNFK